MHLCTPDPLVSLHSRSPVLLDDVLGRTELRGILACTVGE